MERHLSGYCSKRGGALNDNFRGSEFEVESAIAEARPHLKAIEVIVSNGVDGQVNKQKREVSIV